MLIFIPANLKETDRLNFESGKLNIYDVRDIHLKRLHRDRLSQAKYQGRPALFKSNELTKILLYA